MYRIFAISTLCLLASVYSIGQPSATGQKVITQDIDNFWVAFDSARTTNDSASQVHYFQALYIDKATPGLTAFMAARNYSAPLYVRLINKYPKFWASIRPNTLMVNSKANDIEKSIAKLKRLYPGLKDAKMYFTIGGLRSGGTTKDDMVLVGAEIATGNAATDVSEFPNKWLAGVFREQHAENIVSLNVHEYIHTQQQGEAQNLLAQAIKEGSCDFVAELVMGKPLERNYITYGTQHEADLRQDFKQDMFIPAFSRWLYNGANTKTVGDLGYFMGYQICKSYYANATNKKNAIKEIIELNYSDTTAVETFLTRSKYYAEPINKQELIWSVTQQQPILVKTEPVENGATSVDTSLKQLTFVFSKPMGDGYSINLGNKGAETYPIRNVIGFSEDRKRFTVKIDLQPGRQYEFIITGGSFQSTDGYPLLKDYPISFWTK